MHDFQTILSSPPQRSHVEMVMLRDALDDAIGTSAPCEPKTAPPKSESIGRLGGAPEEFCPSPPWDTHANNAARLKDALMPPMDLAYSTLLKDLLDRGMFDDTPVVWTGEFGRTPKHNAQAGRDHWGLCFSMALAGGGVKQGHVHGASDAIGGEVRDGLVTPEDLTATIHHLLGHDPETLIYDRLNRPLPISRGRVLGELLG